MTGTAPPLFLFATIRPRPDCAADARAALEEIIPQTLEEAGCRIFSLFASREEPGVLHLFECFDDDEALANHYAEPYTQRVFERYADWLAAPVAVRRLDPVSVASLAAAVD